VRRKLHSNIHMTLLGRVQWLPLMELHLFAVCTVEPRPLDYGSYLSIPQR
jgi:hypothetical protein